jgi:hypothetical protein
MHKTFLLPQKICFFRLHYYYNEIMKFGKKLFLQFYSLQFIQN